MQHDNPDPALTYFPARGTCDKVRVYLAELDIKYRDDIISGKEAGAARRRAPFGVLPTYRDEDREVSHGLAIMLYLAEKHGPALSLGEKAFLTNIACVCEDILTEMWASEFITAPGLSDYAVAQKKAEFLESYVAPTLTLFVKDIEGRPGPFLLGEQFTFGDACLFAMLEAVDRELPLALAVFPRLAEFRSKVARQPRIAALTESGNRF
eukprot:gnl/Chilomastix_cuspidata/2565.p3 GENE.gnl/Chilomastix_cuspidata/2565~~gnl/Chilomastix_cuspidata/2565.p3  ORF type:complete len:209 (+),score=109.55 gnl/Chilomastix_cuspidata/2565:1117-1743(+)